MLSYSRISTFLECPGALGLYLDKLPELVADVTHSGKIFHEAARIYAVHCKIANRATDIEAVPSIIDQATTIVTHKLVKDGHPAPSLDAIEDAREISMKWAEDALFDWSEETAFEEEIALAKDGTLTGWTSGNVWFRAIIDVMRFEDYGRVVTVTDYKSGWKPVADKLQMDIYAWLVFQIVPECHTVHTVFEFVRFGFDKRETYERADFARLDARIRSHCNTVEEFIKSRMPGGAPEDYRPGIACATCSRALHCPRKAVPINGIVNAEDAAKAVENIALLERDLKATKQGLKAYIDLRGPVAHNGIEWAHHVSLSEGFKDVSDFIREVTAIGENPYACLSVNNTKAKKYRKKLPHILTQTTKTMFKGKAAGEEDED